MNEITYRPMRSADVSQAARLRICQLRDEGAKGTTDLLPSLTTFYAERLADGSFLSWLALYRGEIIATSGLTLTHKPPYFSNPSGTIGLLSNMYTVPAFRRHGIALTSNQNFMQLVL